MSRFLIITVAGAARAIEIAAIREVVRVGSIPPVPGPGPIQRGLTAIRGRLVPVVDPDPAGGPLTGPSLLVVVLTGGRAIGVCVDAVGALVDGEQGGEHDNEHDGEHDGEHRVEAAAPLPPRFDLDRLVEAA